MPATNDSASPLTIEPSILDCLNDDVLQLICASLHDEDEAQKQQHTIRAQDKASLKALSTTCKRLRRFCTPFIFLTFKLACYGENPWADAIKKLEGWNSEFARFVREIDISIIHHDQFGRKEVSSLFIDTLPDKLAQALLVMASTSRRLERFAMTVDKNHLDFFVDALIKHNVVFPTVRRLSIGYCDGNFIDLFPNTVALAVHGLLKYTEDMSGSRVDLLKALPRLPKLERFYFDQFVYRDELLDTLLKAIPKIKTLVLPCGIWTSFEEYVSQLSRFRFVEVLGVADSADLNVGFHPPRCGNAYRGPRGAELQERVRKEGEDADKRVGLAFFSQYPQLKELWLGTYCPRIATAKRDSRGAVANLEWSQSAATCPWSDVF